MGRDSSPLVLQAVDTLDDGTMSKLDNQPITYPEACEYIRLHHRHHLPPQGWKFGIAVNDGEQIVGIVTVGRPVARHLDDGWTLEATRVCTDGTRNACSKLYGLAWQATKALGYKRLITYTLETEGGASLRGAGWICLGKTGGGSWSRKDRPRVDTHPTAPKLIWEVTPD